MKKDYKYFEVNAATPTLGGYITGIDLSIDQPKEAYDALRTALADYKVIFFRDQEMTDEKFLKLGKSFGSLEIHEFFPTRDGYPEIQVISTKGGKTGTDRWHTDVTFREAPSSASILRAVDIPPQGGGDTMWLCTNAAFENLSQPIKELLLKLEGIHDMRFGMTGFVNSEMVEKSVRENPPRTHPAVVAHPHTGAPHLFINSIWTNGFKGLSREEGQALLELLYEHVKKPEFQVRLQWDNNSIAIWDNIATQHYALGDYNYTRVMNRMIVDGLPLEAYA